MHKIETLRTLNIGRFVVEIAAYVEETHPLDMVDFGDEAAEREYVRKIEQGIYPWFCLGVHVYTRGGHEIGSAYLGCVDTYRLHEVGLKDVVAEAVADARDTLAALGISSRPRQSA